MGEGMTKVINLLHQCDGELSAVAYRGTYEKKELIDLSLKLRSFIPDVAIAMAKAAAWDALANRINRLHDINPAQFYPYDLNQVAGKAARDAVRDFEGKTNG
jgi:hypothetical protein